MGRYHLASVYGEADDDDDTDNECEKEEEEENYNRSLLSSIVKYDQQHSRKINGYVHEPYQDHGDHDGSVIHHDDHDDGRYNHSTSIESSARNTFFLQPISPYDDSLDPSTNSREGLFSRYRFWIISMLVIGILVQSYGPPAPPPPPTDHPTISSWTWSDFIMHHVATLVSCAISISSAMGYVGQWCCTGLREDVLQALGSIHYQYTEFVDSRRYICPMQLPSTDNDDNSNDALETSSSLTTNTNNAYLPFFENVLVGQDIAVTAVSEALDAWDMNKKILTENPSLKASSSLLLLFSGMEGVGKMEMAKQISNMMFSHCSSDQQSRLGPDGFNEGVLMLDGVDFAENTREHKVEAQDMSTTTATTALRTLYIQENLFHQIGSHIRRQQGHGAIVVIHGIEHMPKTAFVQLYRHLSSLRSVLPYYKNLSHDYERLLSSSHEKLEVVCDNVIFIFTTQVGVKTYLRTMEKYGTIHGVSKNELDVALRDDVENFFQDLKLSMSSLSIIPFAPLLPSDLEKIFRIKVDLLSAEYSGKYWYRLVATEQASAAIVEAPYVDYYTFQDAGYISYFSSSTSPTVFSEVGAKQLDNDKSIMIRLKSQIKRWLLLMPNPDMIAVLDYDAENDMALFRWCPHPMIKTDDNDNDYSSCPEIGRYSL